MGADPDDWQKTMAINFWGVVHEVARRVVRAVETNAFYVFTHPEQREILRRRALRQDAVFEEES